MSDAVSTDKAPAAIGPYSQGIKAGGFLFTSGAIPIDPASGKVCEGSTGDCTHQCLKNLQAVAEAAGTSLDKAVKLTLFLKDMNDFQEINAVYAQYFSQPFPTRSTVQVAALPLGVRIEIEAVIEL